MEDQEQASSLEKAKSADQNPEKKQKKAKKEKFTWWQTLLILLVTLAISVGAAYYISDKYFWSKYDQSQLKQQLESYKAQVDAKPNEPKNRVNLGYTYFLLEDNDNAIKQLRIALDLDKKYYDAYFNLGLVYNDENRLDDAIKMAQKAADISPKDYKGHLLKGMVYRKMKMYKEAVEALNQANKLMPANTDIIYEVGRVAEDQGQFKNAETIYRDALSYDPLYKPALEGLDRISSKIDNKK